MPKEPKSTTLSLLAFDESVVSEISISDPDTQRRKAFLEWLVTPASLRKPKTQAELASLLGVSRATLSRWKLDPDFSDLVPDAARRRAMAYAGTVMQKLCERAASGNLWAIELYLKYVLRFAEPSEIPAAPDNRVQILIGGKPAEQLPVGLIDPEKKPN